MAHPIICVNRVSCKIGLSGVSQAGRYEGVHIKAVAPHQTTSCNVALTKRCFKNQLLTMISNSYCRSEGSQLLNGQWFCFGQFRSGVFKHCMLLCRLLKRNSTILKQRPQKSRSHCLLLSSWPWGTWYSSFYPSLVWPQCNSLLLLRCWVRPEKPKHTAEGTKDVSVRNSLYIHADSTRSWDSHLFSPCLESTKITDWQASEADSTTSWALSTGAIELLPRVTLAQSRQPYHYHPPRAWPTCFTMRIMTGYVMGSALDCLGICSHTKAMPLD